MARWQPRPGRAGDRWEVIDPGAPLRLPLRERLKDAAAAVGRAGLWVMRTLLLMALQLVRLAICALLLLAEPMLRVVLLGLAFGGFMVTLVFGFLMGDPDFPKWGMLAMSVSFVLLYWLYLFIMSLFMRLPRD